MLSMPGALPKIVSVRVQRAERLRIIPKSDSKHKKYTQKWKVTFLGGKKKMSTSSVLAPAGDPIWDYEVTFKIPSRGEPIALLVTDSEDHHVGQVVIPVTNLHSRPTNANERPTDPSRLQVADLEPTKKVDQPCGTLYYWAWVEEYRSPEDDQKSSRGSMLSISSHKHSKKAASVADSLSYRGSLLSVNSVDTNGKVKKSKHLLKKKHHSKDTLKSALDVTEQLSMGIKPMQPSPVYPRGQSSFDPTATEDHDGSVLGAYSDITGSDLFRSVPSSQVNRNDGATSRISIDRPSTDRPRISMQYSPEPTRTFRAGDEFPTSKQVGKPALLSLEPSSCSTEGGVDVTVQCSNVTEDIVRYATLLIDGYSVQRQDWFHQEAKPGSSGTSEIRIYMPARPPGRCYIELDTMKHGRIRCSQEFVYTEKKPERVAEPEPTHSAPKSILSNNGGSDLGTSKPLQRTGSQRSSLLVRDGRSIRRKQMAAAGGPLKATASVLSENTSPTQSILKPSNDYTSSRTIADRDATPKEKESPEAPSFLDSGFGSEYPSTAAPSLSQAFVSKELPGTPPESSSDEEYPEPSGKPDGFARQSSLRSAASGQSRSALDENFKLENEARANRVMETEGLRAMLSDANSVIESMKKHTIELEKQLSQKSAEVDHLSLELCRLRNRLLQDGNTKYLEMQR